MKKAVQGLFVSSVVLTSGMLLAQEQVSLVKTGSTGSWASSYYMETYGPNADLSKTVFESDHLMTIKYKFGSGASLAAVIAAASAYGGDQKGVVGSGDHYLKLNPGELFSSDTFSLNADIRLYAPTSQKSQEKSIAVKFNPRLIASSSLGNTDLTYMLSPTYYAYQQDAVGNARFAQGHFLAASYNVTPSFALDSFFYPEWKHSGPSKDLAYNNGNIGAGLTGKINDKLKVSSWVEGYNVGLSAKTTRIAASFDMTML